MARGLTRPAIREGDLPYAIGLLGGVGGTVTLLSYGYWIRETGRSGMHGARLCRIDLAAAYIATGVFGVAMLVISSRVTIDRKGADVALVLADQLAGVAGPAVRWVFLVGFWGAVFSSLLGVWQSAPYLFADFLQLSKRRSDEPLELDLAKTAGVPGLSRPDRRWSRWRWSACRCGSSSSRMRSWGRCSCPCWRSRSC